MTTKLPATCLLEVVFLRSFASFALFSNFCIVFLVERNDREMFVEQRLAKIQEVLAVEQSASIERLSKLLSVSKKDTIRRDLIQLENGKYLNEPTEGGFDEPCSRDL